MTRPTQTPIGLALARAAKAVERAFDAALTEAGSSRPAWMILMSLKTSKPKTQSELAEAVGIREATLSHHLNALEDAGLITRTRRPDNRRVHEVALTDAGHESFATLASVARAHDKRLRAGLDESDIARLRVALDRLSTNVEAHGRTDTGSGPAQAIRARSRPPRDPRT